MASSSRVEDKDDEDDHVRRLGGCTDFLFCQIYGVGRSLAFGTLRTDSVNLGVRLPLALAQSSESQRVMSTVSTDKISQRFEQLRLIRGLLHRIRIGYIHYL